MTAEDAAAAVAVFAVAPLSAGLILRGAAGPVTDGILATLAATSVVLRRVPLHVAADRLSGGIDLEASLAAGRAINASGLIARAAGGVLVLPMAERWGGWRAAEIAAAVDREEVGVIALDEGVGDESMVAGLADRCGCVIELADLDAAPQLDVAAIRTARARLPQVTIDAALVTSLCAASVALGIDSLRGALLAARVARVAAALAGRLAADEADATLAARLVLAPRATRLPVAPEDAEPPPGPDDDAAPPDPADAPGDADDADTQATAASDDRVLEAARAALPPGLLASLLAGAQPRLRSAGRSGQQARAAGRGRPAGNRAGVPRDGARLDLIASLRAAAPWQALRGRVAPGDPLLLRMADLRVLRCKPRSSTLTIFAVDASGSQAAARLAEAKGAVELLLADCYVRRDQVALIAFRGTSAALLLPPTRAPARARHCLAALPGGGGTPLALGIDAANAMAEAAIRRGQSPTIVLLTDGQANIARNGAPGRDAARHDAVQAAQTARSHALACLLIDTSNRPQPLARSLAAAMGGRYLPLPRADARAVSAAVRASLP